MKSLEFFKPTLATTLAVLLAWLLSVRPAEAGYTVTLQQVGPDVVATGSGVLNLNGLSGPSLFNSGPPRIRPTAAIIIGATIITGPTTITMGDYYNGGGLISGPTSFGGGSGSSASSGSGDIVGMVAGGLIGPAVIVPKGYVSGTPLWDRAIYSGATLATFGVTAGTYVWKWGTGEDQNFTLKILSAILPATHITNISTRAFVQTGNNVMIGGFIIEGAAPKTVILRAIGPELLAPPFNIPNALSDPTLELHNESGALIARNDNWQTTVIGGIISVSQVSAIQNSGHAPTQPTESAIIATLQPGNYTAILRGKNNTVGVALAEVYDLSSGASSSLGNISTRGFVQTGNNVMIGGFIVQGTRPKRVTLRAIGPELSAPPFNIPNALANPRLELHNGSGALIARNDNWQTTMIGGIITGSQVSAIQNSGHAPTQPSESAIIATLSPGNYTAVVRGVNNTTGVALVEVYDLD
jgi:hypothetical protein